MTTWTGADEGDHAPSVPGAPSVRIDLRDPDPATGQPEATIEQHELWMEREPWAKYTGALGGLRIAAALALRAKRKARGEYVTPHPWFPTLVTTGIIASVILTITLIAWLLERFA